MGLETDFWPRRISISGIEAFVLVCTSSYCYWMRTVTIESSLTRGGVRVTNLYNSTYVKIEASKPMWSGNVVRLRDNTLVGAYYSKVWWNTKGDGYSLNADAFCETTVNVSKLALLRYYAKLTMLLSSVKDCAPYIHEANLQRRRLCSRYM